MVGWSRQWAGGGWGGPVSSSACRRAQAAGRGTGPQVARGPSAGELGSGRCWPGGGQNWRWVGSARFPAERCASSWRSQWIALSRSSLSAAPGCFECFFESSGPVPIVFARVALGVAVVAQGSKLLTPSAAASVPASLRMINYERRPESACWPKVGFTEKPQSQKCG
eukprot:364282-Chlamydomonas_euryale.AAC.35